MNHVRKLRERNEWSQRKLAALAETSQSMIQRVEVESIDIPLEVAQRLARALQQPFAQVFPDLAEAQVRTPPGRGAVVLHFTGGVRLAFDLDPEPFAQARAKLRGETSAHFVLIFDASLTRVAVRMDQVESVFLLRETIAEVRAIDGVAEVQAHFIDALLEPLEVSLLSGTETRALDLIDYFDNNGQGVISLKDVDGEDVWINLDRVALIQVSHAVLATARQTETDLREALDPDERYRRLEAERRAAGVPEAPSAEPTRITAP